MDNSGVIKALVMLILVMVVVVVVAAAVTTTGSRITVAEGEALCVV
jgi:hypothetical protein